MWIFFRKWGPGAEDSKIQLENFSFCKFEQFWKILPISYLLWHTTRASPSIQNFSMKFKNFNLNFWNEIFQKIYCLCSIVYIIILKKKKLQWKRVEKSAAQARFYGPSAIWFILWEYFVCFLFQKTNHKNNCVYVIEKCKTYHPLNESLECTIILLYGFR